MYEPKGILRSVYSWNLRRFQGDWPFLFFCWLYAKQKAIDAMGQNVSGNPEAASSALVPHDTLPTVDSINPLLCGQPGRDTS